MPTTRQVCVPTASIQADALSFTSPIDVHFQPQGAALPAGTTLLENFLQGITSGTVIVGSSDTTPVDSLVPALEQIKLNANIPALHQNLITAANIEFPVNIVQTGIATTTVSLSNPFTASINLLVVTANAIFQNLTLGSVLHQSHCLCR